MWAGQTKEASKFLSQESSRLSENKKLKSISKKNIYFILLFDVFFFSQRTELQIFHVSTMEIPIIINDESESKNPQVFSIVAA